jgi:hypothetical protein
VETTGAPEGKKKPSPANTTAGGTSSGTDPTAAPALSEAQLAQILKAVTKPKLVAPRKPVPVKRAVEEDSDEEEDSPLKNFKIPKKDNTKQAKFILLGLKKAIDKQIEFAIYKMQQL